MLPGWAKARGMAVYLVVFQGGNAIGSAVFGILAAGGLDRTAGSRPPAWPLVRHLPSGAACR